VERSTAARVNQKFAIAPYCRKKREVLISSRPEYGRCLIAAIELQNYPHSLRSPATFPRRFPMNAEMSDLVVGEIIEIKYRVPRRSGGRGSDGDLSDRWITAKIVHQDDDAPPMARLADGQLTDIRAYMTWRRLPGLDAA
jgi:hypothetical protein